MQDNAELVTCAFIAKGVLYKTLTGRPTPMGRRLDKIIRKHLRSLYHKVEVSVRRGERNSEIIDVTISKTS